jgi:DNA-binding transcriptional ArsR family regulator
MSEGASSPAPRWELYRVLGEPARLRLLALAAQEELAIGELAEILDESQPNVSRHAAALRQAGLLAVRKEGTRTFLRLSAATDDDAVVADAIASGRALCEADGSMRRVATVLAAREQGAREFFARTAENASVRTPPELGAYLSALAPLLPRRALAVDAGTGDGGFLEVLAPIYGRVVAVDRSPHQLARAKERVSERGFRNVVFVEGEPAGAEVKKAVGKGADAVFASRILHHASKPGRLIGDLTGLCAPGGALVLVDYEAHEDERLRDQADVWLGFEPAELRRFAEEAGLEDVQIARIPASHTGRGPEAHLAWQVLTGRVSESHEHSRTKPRVAAEGTRKT